MNFNLYSTLKIGIVGCGEIGTYLAKELIQLKDMNQLDCTLTISTRRPKIVNSLEINADDSVSILFDNELIFKNSDVIFLCIQPHQLDNLIQEIEEIFTERLEKIKKQLDKGHLNSESKFVYPTIISLLAGITVEKIQSYFSFKLPVFKTNINSNVDLAILESHIYDIGLKQYTTYKKTKNFSDNPTQGSFSLEKFNVEFPFWGNWFIDIENLKLGSDLNSLILNDEGLKYLDESFYHLIYSTDLICRIINNMQIYPNFPKQQSQHGNTLPKLKSRDYHADTFKKFNKQGVSSIMEFADRYAKQSTKIQPKLIFDSVDNDIVACLVGLENLNSIRIQGIGMYFIII